MATLEELKRQRNLSDRDMDEVIERATRLQEKAGGTGRSVDDVKAVAKELDIDARFVDQAMAELERERAARAAEAAEARASRQRMIKVGGLVAAGAAAVLLLMGWAGAGRVRDAERATALAEANLTTVLSRQATLVPQLVALSGGDVSGLRERGAALERAPDLKARLAAAEALRLEMAALIGKLPPAADPATAQQRLSLQHEIVGAQNRVTVEQRRYEEALAGWRAAAGSPSGKVAVTLGFARAVPL